MNKSETILIVGHNDIIEKSLFHHLQSNGFSNVFSSSVISLNTAIQPSVYDFFQRQRPSYVFLGSVRSGGIEANQKYPAEFIYHNLESQNNILYASQKFGVKKLIYFASSCVYPKECPQPMKEEFLLTGELEKTSEPYAIAKIAGIKLCESFKRQFGFNAVAVVPATVYGPGEEGDPEKSHVISALIHKFVIAVKNNEKEVKIWGSGHPRREFLYVDDFIEASLLLMEKLNDGSMINVGTGEDITIKELAELIAQTAAYKGKIVYDSTKPDGVKQKLLDHSRMSKLGWRAKVSFKEGITRTYAWYKEKIK